MERRRGLCSCNGLRLSESSPVKTKRKTIHLLFTSLRVLLDVLRFICSVLQEEPLICKFSSLWISLFDDVRLQGHIVSIHPTSHLLLLRWSGNIKLSSVSLTHSFPVIHQTSSVSCSGTMTSLLKRLNNTFFSVQVKQNCWYAEISQQEYV